MKILEIIPSLGSGGGERFVVDLSNEFVDKGHSCSILTLYNPSNSDILRHFIKPNVYTNELGKLPGFDIMCLYKTYNYIRKQCPDVVHVHLRGILYIFLAALLCRKVKFFATIHSEAKREAGNSLHKWARMFLFKTGLVTPITISVESEKSFRDFYNISSDIIPNGCAAYHENAIDVDEYQSFRKDVDYLFFHAGRIHPVKNQLMLVEAFEELINQGVSARLVIAGRQDDAEVYQTLRRYFSNNIVYIGERSDIIEIMKYSDAFCLSSNIEGMPISIIEAMSVGCVSIVTPVGGCLNVVKDSVTGFIAKNVTKDAYLSSLKKYIATPINVRNAMKKACITEFNTNYSISITASAYINLFTSKLI